jgi:hypothetical protein
MDRVQTAADPILDRPTSNSGRKQLLSRDHTMLPLGELRNNAIRSTRVAFAPNSGVDATFMS